MTFRPNPNFITELRTEPLWSIELERQAEQVQKYAKLLAPEKTGYYKRRIEVAKDVVGWRVESTDPFGHLVEWGSSPHEIEVVVDGKKKKKMVGGNPPYGPLRIGARAAGLRYVPDPKL